MCGIHGGLATLLKESSPFSVYLQYYAHRLNLVSTDSLFLVQNFKNAFGTIKIFHNFHSKSANRLASFKDMKVEGELLSLQKCLSKTRWACRYEPVRAVNKQLLAFLVLGKYLDVKTSSNA